MILTAAADPRLLDDEVTASTGVFASAYTQPGATVGDALWAAGTSGRYLLGGATGDLAVLALVPLTGNTVATSFNLTPRIGWTGRRFSILAGVSLQLAPHALPAAELLPSLRAQVAFGPVGITAGLFDVYGQLPFHLSVELKGFSVGYVAPLGAVTSARIRLTHGLSLRLLAFAYRLVNVTTGMATIGVAWEDA
jgi:hypothetical protein